LTREEKVKHQREKIGYWLSGKVKGKEKEKKGEK